MALSREAPPTARASLLGSEDADASRVKALSGLTNLFPPAIITDTASSRTVMVTGMDTVKALLPVTCAVTRTTYGVASLNKSPAAMLTVRESTLASDTVVGPLTKSKEYVRGTGTVGSQPRAVARAEMLAAVNRSTVRVVPPCTDRVGRFSPEVMTSAVPSPEDPKKLLRLAVKWYVASSSRIVRGMVTVSDVTAVRRALIAATEAPAVGLRLKTDHDTCVQSRPPEPSDPLASRVKSSHAPSSAGATIAMAGTTDGNGGLTATLCCAAAGELRGAARTRMPPSMPIMSPGSTLAAAPKNTVSSRAEVHWHVRAAPSPPALTSTVLQSAVPGWLVSCDMSRTIESPADEKTACTRLGGASTGTGARDTDAVGEKLEVGVALPVGDADGIEVPEGVGELDGVRVGEAEIVVVGLLVGDFVGIGVAPVD